MSAAVHARRGTALFPEPVATDRARHLIEELMADFRTGSWVPTPLERRVAELLLVSMTGDGLLTSRRVRAALWEGSIAMTHENDGRFARALADLVPVLDGPGLASLDVVEAAGEFVGAVVAAASPAVAA